jgi:hypothetical protein
LDTAAPCKFPRTFSVINARSRGTKASSTGNGQELDCF